VTPQPAPTPPAAPSPGVGTPGTAETGTGPCEAGRLDRIRSRLRWVVPVWYLLAAVWAGGRAINALRHGWLDTAPFWAAGALVGAWAAVDAWRAAVHRTPARVRAELETGP
jgi:hypothetical protein